MTEQYHYNRNWVEQVFNHCIKEIQNDEPTIHNVAVVMLYTKLCELEMGLGVVHDGVANLKIALQSGTPEALNIVTQPPYEEEDLYEQERETGTDPVHTEED